MIDETKMKLLLDGMLELVQAELQATKNLVPKVIVIGPENEIVPMPLNPEMFGSTEGRAYIFEMIRKVARTPHLQVQAAVVIVDGFTLKVNKKLTPEHERLIKENQHNITELEGLGVGKKMEAFFLTFQSPISTLMISQQYERVGDKIIFGDVVKTDSSTGTFFGRMFIWEGDENTIQ